MKGILLTLIVDCYQCFGMEPNYKLHFCWRSSSSIKSAVFCHNYWKGALCSIYIATEYTGPSHKKHHHWLHETWNMGWTYCWFFLGILTFFRYLHPRPSRCHFSRALMPLKNHPEILGWINFLPPPPPQKKKKYLPQDSWEWYIYLHEWLIFLW